MTGTAQSAPPKLLGKFKDWNAFRVEDGTETICFVVSEPKSTSPKNVKRGDIFFMITDWGPKNSGLEPSVITGYPYKVGSSVTVTIGSDKFELFTQEDAAWLRDGDSEKRIVNAMRRGSRMIVTGTSQRGTLTKDNYSLSGVTAALEHVAKNCT
ncbi:MAG: invasion associated locus B family protein [Pseudomonadota bacterium]